MSSMEDLVARLEKLEKTNRRYQRGFLALVICAALAIPMIPSDSVAGKGFKTVITDRIALMSGPKKVGMLLSSRGGKNMISLMGPAGKTRLTLNTNEKGQPMVALYDAAGKVQTKLRYTKKLGAHWVMIGSDGKVVVQKLK